MKKYLLIILGLVGSVSFANAQKEGGGQRSEKIQALKIAFITQNSILPLLKQKNSGLFTMNIPTKLGI